jgi:hypothetical protein
MGLLSKIFGEKVKTPEFTSVDIDATQEGAADANIGIIPKASRLALSQQKADQATLLQGLRSAIPDYDEMVSGERSIIADMMAGKLPNRDRIVDLRAAQHLGQAGSEFARYGTARDLGISELDLMTQGLGQARAFKQQQAQVGMAQPMSVGYMFQTPQQRLAHLTSERNMEFQRNMFDAKMKAAPDPIYSGITKTAIAGLGAWAGASAFGSTLGGAGGALLGGMMMRGGGGGMATGLALGGFMGRQSGGGSFSGSGGTGMASEYDSRS